MTDFYTRKNKVMDMTDSALANLIANNTQAELDRLISEIEIHNPGCSRKWIRERISMFEKVLKIEIVKREDDTEWIVPVI